MRATNRTSEMEKTALEDAIRLISLELKDNPNADKVALIEKVSQQFNLNPLQCEFLMNKYVFGK